MINNSEVKTPVVQRSPSSICSEHLFIILKIESQCYCYGCKMEHENKIFRVQESWVEVCAGSADYLCCQCSLLLLIRHIWVESSRWWNKQTQVKWWWTIFHIFTTIFQKQNPGKSCWNQPDQGDSGWKECNQKFILQCLADCWDCWKSNWERSSAIIE